MHSTVMELDFIEEIRLRCWARENYVVADDRDESWHPVVLEEMRKRDLEVGTDELVLHNDST